MSNPHPADTDERDVLSADKKLETLQIQVEYPPGLTMRLRVHDWQWIHCPVGLSGFFALVRDAPS